MRKRAEALARHLGAAVIGLLGTCGVVGLSLGMNLRAGQEKATEPVSVVEPVIAAAKPPKSGPARKTRTNPVKRARRAPSPGPALAAGLAGLDFGLGDAADLALADATASLIGDLGAAVMDEDAVEDGPKATSRTPPSFPARARSLGQSGFVTVTFVVDVDGSVQDVAVVESDPPGVFDDAATDAVESWSFEPGRHEGIPVAVRVRQTLRFALE